MYETPLIGEALPDFRLARETRPWFLAWLPGRVRLQQRWSITSKPGREGILFFEWRDCHEGRGT